MGKDDKRYEITNELNNEGDHCVNQQHSGSGDNLGPGSTKNVNIIIAKPLSIALLLFLFLIVFAVIWYFWQGPKDNENANGITEFSTSAIETQATLTTTFLTTTTTPATTTVPSETLQTTTTTLAATTTSRPVQTERPYTPPPPIDPQPPERTEPPKTITVTQTEPPTEPTVPPTEPTVPPTEPPTEPPTDPPIIEGVDANGLAYRIENGTATITGYQGTATEVVIPKYVADVPVYAIGKKAFSYKTDIKKVIIEGIKVYGLREEVTLLEGAERIEAEAFYGCTSLEEVILPSSISYIGANAFFKNNSTTSITIYYEHIPDHWNNEEFVKKAEAGLDVAYICVKPVY